MNGSEVIEAWRTNHRINRMLIDAVTEDGWTATLSSRGGRDVGRQFAHLHDVRVYHLEERAKDLADGLERFASKDAPKRTPTKDEVLRALETSADRVTTFLEDLATEVAGRRGFRKGLPTTLAYFIAHESHHRGSIILTLKQAGHPVPKDVRYGIWDWDRR